MIKEICKQESKNRYVIRTNTYGRTLEYFLMLVEEAKKDFSDLKDNEIEIIHYGGMSYSHTYGIEFDRQEIKEGYTEVGSLENTL